MFLFQMEKEGGGETKMGGGVGGGGGSCETTEEGEGNFLGFFIKSLMI